MALPWPLVRLLAVRCRGAVLHWVHHNSASPMDFIERHLGFSPDGGDGSVEALLITMLVMIITVVGFRWAL
ncbi:MAG: hypothetical protein WBA14_17405, partial [Pseudolabrys sp.]